MGDGATQPRSYPGIQVLRSRRRCSSVRIPSIEVTIFIARTLSGSSACPNGKPLRLRRVADLSRSGANQALLCCQVSTVAGGSMVMSKGCYHLGEMTAAMIRMYCPDCHRFAQFKRARLRGLGPDKPMPTMLPDLKPYNIGGGTSGPQCQLRYWDSMTPDARAEASAKASSFALAPNGQGSGWRRVVVGGPVRQLAISLEDIWRMASGGSVIE